MIELRGYQGEGITAIRDGFAVGFSAILFVLATGGGKTIIFAAICQSAAARGKRIVILCHRMELIDQIVEALGAFGVQPDIVAAGYPRRASNVIVASVQTLVRRLDAISAPDLVIIDECHHLIDGNTWSKILAAWPRAKRIGFTATPIRLDGRGLASNFQTMIRGPSIQWLTEHGYLAPAKVFAPPSMDLSGLHTRMGDYVVSELELAAGKPSITGDAISEWRKHGAGQPALVFTVSIAHADAVAKQFREAGVNAMSFSGKTDRGLRRQIVSDFRAGAISVLCQCDLANEGFDIPGVHVGIMLRPTQSMGLWRQQVGRILRPCEGKESAVILDMAGNTSKFGLPADEPDWQLTGDEETRKRKDRPESCRICPQCWAANQMRARECFECHAPFPVKSREVEQRDGELVELTAEKIAKRLERQTQGMTQSLEGLREIARRKGYSPTWADHVYAARQLKRAAK